MIGTYTTHGLMTPADMADYRDLYDLDVELEDLDPEDLMELHRDAPDLLEEPVASDCQHLATHIMYNKGRQYIVCTHCGTTVAEA
jgi:hypothetical protein